jgi:hypothetical protein
MTFARNQTARLLPHRATSCNSQEVRQAHHTKKILSSREWKLFSNVLFSHTLLHCVGLTFNLSSDQPRRLAAATRA